ncbi:hypothetical protein ACFOD0_08435 [Shewanella intestini]|uniref:ResB-like domain-containing protein n=1 Tax=Shewanella intestini TaxID=2017544 RepID=A0ABS5I0R3_9GAMM|nr:MULTISPECIES: hypothetical protein [Shewanella]MBR9726905.1 hypothetical protein [Shewanella intestini]MRG34529.1 hypothetical protein [Shewanella sp. XMDDZSB0408]
MKTNWLYSMRLAFVLIASVSLWFGVGVLLNNYQVSRNAFSALNELPMAQWGDTLINTPIVGLWLLVLFGLMAMLAVNTVLCIWRDLMPVWRQKRWRSPRIVMMPIHVLTLLVFLFHGVDLVFIHGHDKVMLHEGESFQSGQYKITLTRINYRDDVAYITANADGKSKLKRITHRDLKEFDPRHNDIELSVTVNDKTYHGNAKFMAPFNVDNLYVMVTDFSVGFGEESKGVKAQIIAVHNPIVNYFYICYVALILTLLFQIYFFWHRNRKKGTR